MRNSIRLFKVFGISINIHITFFLLLFLVLPGGIKWLFLVVAIFFFVTVHELCHSLVAKRFGIIVREITLFPIGGVSSMTKMPEKPSQEFAISIAGPLSNIVIILVFFYPLKYILGADVLLHGLSTRTWPLTFAYVYWINLILACFNMLPAFPMDGGRVLRSILASRLGYQKATRIAVSLGHIFALLFVYFGIVKLNVILIVIAVFIYTAASSEELQVDIKETLKRFKVRDILSRNFYTVASDAKLSKVLELIFHSRQEDFPVVDGGHLVGFLTRQDIISNVHQFGMDRLAGEAMTVKYFKVNDADPIIKAQNIMQENGMRALTVMKDDAVVGVITLEDIGRAYSMASRMSEGGG